MRCSRGKEIAMKWPNVLSGFSGLKPLMTEVAGRLFRENTMGVFGETYEDKTILVEPFASFKLCQFTRCCFQWEAEDNARPTKIFSDCNFDDCDFGMPVAEFLAFAYGAIIDQQLQLQLTRQQALEEAVRRIRRSHPLLTEQCLDPSCRDERQYLAQWVSAEYRRIIAEAA
jgi:hypothetical protein